MIIAAYNPKGGVGKTTTVVNLGAALADRGRTVLVIDLEADLNASISLGVRPGGASPSIAEVLLHEARPADAVRTVARVDNLFLVPGSPVLAHMDTALRNVRQPERRLADVVRPLAREFDFIIMDAPAGYGVTATAVTLAATKLLVPIRAEYLGLESLAHFLRFYRDRRTARRATADVAGMLLTMVDYRRQATREIVEIIRAHNRRGVVRTEIPLDPRAAEAPSHGVPLNRYTRSRAGQAYDGLAAELLRRLAR